MSQKGFFITIEKTSDGLGGSTQAKLLYERLVADGFDVVLTREPSDTELGRYLSPMLKDTETFFHKGYELSKQTELLLFNADRAQHHYEVVAPALARGSVVVSDRYFDSTLAYQGGGRGWDEDTLNSLHTIATDFTLPNLTIVLDGVSFIELENGDRFERSGKDFFNGVRAKMLQQVNTSDRYILVNANRPIEQNEDEIYEHVIKRMQEVGYGQKETV